MRVSSRDYYADLQRNLAAAQQDLQRLSRQLSSGRRLTRPSDDPVAVGEIISARSDVAAATNRQRTLRRAILLTGSADNALDSISSALRQAQDLVLTAGRPGETDAARSAVAEMVRSVRERVLDVANISVKGEYLFAGKLARQAPFEDGVGGVTYVGDSEGMQLWVAPGRPMEVTIPGDRLLNFEDAGGNRAVPEVDTDLFALLDDIATAIEAGDADQVSALGADLDRLCAHVVQQRGVLGARTQRIEDALDAAQDAEVTAREVLSDAEDVDIAAALMELQARQVSYQAALTATSRLAGLPTLFELGW